MTCLSSCQSLQLKSLLWSYILQNLEIHLFLRITRLLLLSLSLCFSYNSSSYSSCAISISFFSQPGAKLSRSSARAMSLGAFKNMGEWCSKLSNNGCSNPFGRIRSLFLYWLLSLKLHSTSILALSKSNDSPLTEGLMQRWKVSIRTSDGMVGIGKGGVSCGRKANAHPSSIRATVP